MRLMACAHILVTLGFVFWSAWRTYQNGVAESWPVLLVTLILIVSYFSFLQSSLKVASLSKRLRKTGIPVRAKITNSKITGKHVNQQPILKIAVEYSCDGKNLIRGEVEQIITFNVLPLIVPQGGVNILVDPKDQKIFVLDI